MSQRQYDRVPDSARTAEAPRSPAAMLRRALSKQMTRTIAGYGLLAAGDHVLVAVSGGKDSYTLLDLLWHARARAPFKFEITGVDWVARASGLDAAAGIRQALPQHRHQRPQQQHQRQRHDHTHQRA